MKLGNFIIVASMAAIAFCFGFLLITIGDIATIVASSLAVALFAVLGTIQLLITAIAERRETARTMQDLSEAVRHCMNQTASLSERLDTFGTTVTSQVDEQTGDIRQDIELVAEAVRELADAVDRRPTGGAETEPPPVDPVARSNTSAAQPEPASGPAYLEPVWEQPLAAEANAPQSALPDISAYVPDPDERPGSTSAAIDVTDNAARAMPAVALTPRDIVRETDGEAAPAAFSSHAPYSDAIFSGRADILLQPIVTLPQRRVQFYDSITRLRTNAAGPVAPGHYRPLIGDHDSIVELDRMTLARVLQIARRLAQRSPDIRIFMPLSPRALSRDEFVADATRLFEQFSDVAGHVVFEIAQSDLRAIGPVEDEAMMTFGDLGARYALDDVAGVDFDLKETARRRFRHARVAADILLDGQAVSNDIHPADLSGLMMRYNIRLIATGVKREQTVIDLIDYDVPFAQGDLFSSPRPVRADVLDGSAAPADKRRAAR